MSLLALLVASGLDFGDVAGAADTLADLDGAPSGATEGPVSSCPVLRWAESGGMALTGPPEVPCWPSGDVIGRLTEARRCVQVLARRSGHDCTVDVAALLTGRAGLRGARRQGRTSVGGTCRLLRTGDSWVAVNLARTGDLDLLPALTGGTVPPDTGPTASCRTWRRLAAACRQRTSVDLVVSGQELGLPIASLGSGAATGAQSGIAPWVVTTGGAAVDAPVRNPLVVDFSALWAGPICAHILGRCGARVVKVEDRHRPDASSSGDPALFDELHRGHLRLVADFGNRPDRELLEHLVDAADVVIEASRPRALEQLGFSPERFLRAREGRTWVSLTGYGRSGPRSNWVAFGDDAAVAGGLVGTDAGGDPVFCADAIADPATGLLASVAVLSSTERGGGHLIECSMAGTSSWIASAGGCGSVHRVEQRSGRWTVSHGGERRTVAAPARTVAVA
ncbi:MAG: CoA transferase [Acidimicrobiales bacterium]